MKKVKDDSDFSSLIHMTKRIIASMRDPVQLRRGKFDVTEMQFSGNTLQTVMDVSQENSWKSKL